MVLPTRKPNRLSNYDYSQNGAYFVTVCVKDRRNILWQFGWETIVCPGDPVPLSKTGEIIESGIGRISEIYENVEVAKYVIMPNHVHMIIVRLDEGGGRPMVAPTLGLIIQHFKGWVSKQVGNAIWQKSFYDRVIRNEQDYQQTWKYIDENPLKWQDDQYFNTDI